MDGQSSAIYYIKVELFMKIPSVKLSVYCILWLIIVDMALCIAFISKENSPLFVRCTNSSQELQFHYIVHTCLDFVEEKIVQSNKSGSDVRELYLGMLYSNEEVKAYGFVTNTKIKIVIIIDSTNSLLRDNEIRAMFRKLHNAYTELVCNPFYIPGDLINARSFCTLVDEILKSTVS